MKITTKINEDQMMQRTEEREKEAGKGGKAYRFQ
jgi:hypothetical protein